MILFSDILTPLTGMNIPFDIIKGKGPIIHKPIRNAEGVAEVTDLVPEEAVPYVGDTLRALKAEVSMCILCVHVLTCHIVSVVMMAVIKWKLAV